MSFYFLHSFVLLFVVSYISHADTFPFDGRIISGVPTTRGEFPSIVSLYSDYFERHFCGGAILNKYWVLTAAHCVRPGNNDIEITVIAGEHDQYVEEGSEQERSVEKVIIHPNYGSSGNGINGNDLALIKLTSPLTFNKFVKNATLPSSPHFKIKGELTVVGWGDTIEGAYQGSDKLLKVTVPFVPSGECKEAYEPYGEEIGPGNFCAGAKDKDSCQGDSGGPIYKDNILVGIVSWGYGCGREGFPGVYAGIPHFLKWINSMVKYEKMPL